MHSLIHVEYAEAVRDAAERRVARPRAVARPGAAPHAPPGRVRGRAARVIALVAARLDREAARRALA